jgi:hypothetical protein
MSGSYLLIFVARYEHFFFLVRFLSLFIFSAAYVKISKLGNVVKDIIKHHDHEDV